LLYIVHVIIIVYWMYSAMDIFEKEINNIQLILRPNTSSSNVSLFTTKLFPNGCNKRERF